jgi:hypothetical protein
MVLSHHVLLVGLPADGPRWPGCEEVAGKTEISSEKLVKRPEMVT